MEIFGVGTSEFIFIILIAIIILGPKDMQKAGRTIGRFLNQLVKSDSWKIFQQTSSEIRNLPRTLMREANMEMMEAEKDLRRAIDPHLDLSSHPSTTPSSSKETSSPSSSTEQPSDQTEVSLPESSDQPTEQPADQPTENKPDENA